MKQPTKKQFKAFAEELINGAFEALIWDGWDIQELGVKHGLLEITPVAERCCEYCNCAQDGFPADCYKKTYRASR